MPKKKAEKKDSSDESDDSNKLSGSEEEEKSPHKKMKISNSIIEEFSATRLECADSILDFKSSKLGDGFKSRVRHMTGDAGTVLRECKGKY